jgi:hypothetical protein
LCKSNNKEIDNELAGLGVDGSPKPHIVGG